MSVYLITEIEKVGKILVVVISSLIKFEWDEFMSAGVLAGRICARVEKKSVERIGFQTLVSPQSISSGNVLVPL